MKLEPAKSVLGHPVEPSNSWQHKFSVSFIVLCLLPIACCLLLTVYCPLLSTTAFGQYDSPLQSSSSSSNITTGVLGTINLIFDDNTTMLYIGEDIGINKGDAVSVFQGNKEIARISITETGRYYSKGEFLISPEKPLQEGEKVFFKKYITPLPEKASIKSAVDTEETPTKSSKETEEDSSKKETEKISKTEEKTAPASKRRERKEKAPKKKEPEPIEEEENFEPEPQKYMPPRREREMQRSYPTTVYTITRFEGYSRGNGAHDSLYNMISLNTQLDVDVLGSIFYISKYDISDNREVSRSGGVNLLKIWRRGTTFSIGYTASETRSSSLLGNRNWNTRYTDEIITAALHHPIGTVENKGIYRFNAVYTSLTELDERQNLRVGLSFLRRYKNNTSANYYGDYTYSFDFHAHTSNQYGTDVHLPHKKHSFVSLGFLYIDKTYSVPQGGLNPRNDRIYRITYTQKYQ